MNVCPTDIVEANAETVWRCVTEPELLGRWPDGHLVQAPPRAIGAGDRVVFRTGPGFTVVFEIGAVEPMRQVAIDVRLPFGIVNHEVVHLSPVGERRCRVTFN